MTLLNTRLEWQRIVTTRRTTGLAVALLATFTVNPITPYIGVALEEAGIPADIFVAPYDQIFQECADPNSDTAAQRPAVLVVWPRLEDLWAGRPYPLDDPSEGYQTDLLGMIDVAVAAATRMVATLVFVLPAIPEMRPLGVGDASNPVGVFAVGAAAREAARARLAASAGVLIADAEEVIRTIGSSRAVDWHRTATARIPYGEEMFAATARRIAHLIQLQRQGPKKVVAVDADNTLWGGVVGEDGPEGVDLLDNGPGAAFRDFQRYLLELRRSGCLIVLTSKNEEHDVWAGFARREMVLSPTDLAAWRVNWSPKSTSIREIAEELNLGTDSFVLIDDSAIERSEVEEALPHVRTVPMPEAPEDWFDTVTIYGGLDRLPPTASDRARADSYEGESRRRVVRKAMSNEEFLRSLALHVEIAEPTLGDLARFAQLVAKTNQFTLGGYRRTAAELSSCIADSRYVARLVDAHDRFGDYGVIGAMLVDLFPPQEGLPGGIALLDTFVLSCRAMGRGIELAMLAAAFGLAGTELWTIVERGPSNTPCRDFLAGFGAEPGQLSALRRPSWPSHISATTERYASRCQS